MEKLIMRRSPVRSSFTKTVNVLKDELEKKDADQGIVTDKFTKLEELMNQLKVMDEEVLNTLLDKEGVEENEIEKESEGAEMYSDTFITMRRLVNEKTISNSLEDRKSESFNVVSKTRNIKLPEIVLKEFDGELINYLPFWSQFKEIHNNDDLSDCEKFHYLVQAMVPGSRAREFIDSYPVTAENYEKAIFALKNRFGKKELLTEVYVRELLKLVISNVGNQKEKLPLSKLVDRIEAHLRALECMKVDMNTNAAWLYPLVESCLSEELLRAWQRSYVCGDDKTKLADESSAGQNSRLALLMKFLHQEVEREEKVSLARTGFQTQSVYGAARDKVKIKETRMFTAAGLFVGKETRCVFCGKLHHSKDCLSIRSLSLKEKIDLLKEKRCCLKCLRPGHIAKFCKCIVRCHVCSKGHHVVLCPTLSKGEKESESVKTTNTYETMQSTLIKNACSPEIALMTLEVKIVGRKTKQVRALFDTGSQRSYILRSTAEELDLMPISTENLAHTLFGGSQTESKPHQKFHLKICRPNSKDPLEIELLDQEVICGEIPRVPKYPLLKELKRNKIWVSDIGTGSTEIELLIGSDIYGKLLTGNVKQLQGGLTAIETKLGWTICGPIETSLIDRAPSFSMLITNLAIREMKVQELWKLDTIGIRDPIETVSKKEEEELAQDSFMKELSRNEEGRYCVGLPWIGHIPPEMPSNRTIAEKRLASTLRKLKNVNKLEDYNRVFYRVARRGCDRKGSD